MYKRNRADEKTMNKVECYRKGCKHFTNCDYLRKASCMYYMNEKEFWYHRKLNFYYCKKCGNRKVIAKWRGKILLLCTNCNNVLQTIRREQKEIG